MAIMHPSDISKRKHVPSEEKFFNACRDTLPDKYHVFFSVRWYSEENGQRIDSECDFLIFNPDYGFLCVECKGGNRIFVEDDTWYLNDADGDRKLRRSPYAQSEESMRFFKNYYEQEMESIFPGTYGHAVAFPNYAITAPITVDSPLALTIDMRDMANLHSKIVSIFKYFDAHKRGHANFLSPDSQRRFIALINKRVALAIAAGALIEDKQRELLEINNTQDVVIDFLTHYKRAFIIGGAGTGKTWIAIKKMKRCLLAGKKPLYICSNPLLAEKVRKEISHPVEAYSIDELARIVLGEKYATAPVLHGCKLFAELFANVQLPEYDLVVVDEAQDFTEDWAACADMLVKHDGQLYVFHDESQNIFNRSFGTAFGIESEPFVMRYNIRNTSNIYQYTKNNTHLGTDTMANQIEGVEPEVKNSKRKEAVLSYIDAVINRLVNKEGISPDKITILSNRSQDACVLSSVSEVGGYPISPVGQEMRNSIRYSSVEDFKGLESDIILYINHTYRDEVQTPEIQSMRYTAYTRARFYLYIVNYQISL